MSSREAVLLKAARFYRKDLVRRHDKAKAAVDERDGALTKILEIRKRGGELIQEIVSSGDLSVKRRVQGEIESLAKEEKRLFKITEQDWKKLSDRHFELKMELDDLDQEIIRLEMVLSRRGAPTPPPPPEPPEIRSVNLDRKPKGA